MLARKAAAKSPFASTTGSPVSMLVATALKGVGNASKLVSWRV